MTARFGLDVGRGGVKLVRCDLDARGAGSVRGVDRPLEAGLEGGARRAAVMAALREVGAELGARPKDEVHLAVPRAEAIVKWTTLPSQDDVELERMVRFQAQRDLPFELDQVVLAWGRVGAPGPAGQEIAFAAVRRETIDELRSIVLEAGLLPGSIEVSTEAAARSLVLLGPKAPDGGAPEEVLLVEVGQASTDILLVERGRLVFSRSASVGCGPQGGEAAAGEAWLERLGQEVVRSLGAARAARGSTRTGPPEALCVAGGGAARPALARALEARVGCAPVVLDGLAPGVGGKRGEAAGGPRRDDTSIEQRASTPRLGGGVASDESRAADLARGARFVVARGLADPRPVVGVPPLDLAHRAQARGERKTRVQTISVVAAAVAACILLAIATKLAISAREERVARLEEQKATLAPLVERARRLQAELAAANVWEARTGRELEVLLLISDALPKDAFLTSLRWADRKPLTIVGRAKDWDEVGRFLSALENHPLVATAPRLDRIQSPRNERGREDDGVEWSIVVELRDGTPGAAPGGRAP